MFVFKIISFFNRYEKTLENVSAFFKKYHQGRTLTYDYSYLFFKIHLRFSSSYHHHHHHVVPPARISLNISPHFSLSFIASDRPSGLHPVSSHSCCMSVWAVRPAFDWPYVGVHRSTSLTSSSLLLQQCPACLARLNCIVFVMGGKWPYSWCLVGCCRRDLFNNEQISLKAQIDFKL